jgi:hypothetical protein
LEQRFKLFVVKTKLKQFLILLEHPFAMVYLVVTLKKNKLTLQHEATMLIQVFFLMLDKHMCTDLKQAMVQ